MTILIDASEAYRNQTGIGRFSRSLIAALRMRGASLLFSPPDWESRQHDQSMRTLSKRISHFSEHLWLTQIASAARAHTSRAQVVHSLSFFAPLMVHKLPITTTVFDLAYFDLPGETDRFWGTYARRMMPLFVRHAAHIFTPSQIMQTQIAEQFHVPSERITCIYGGVDAMFQPISDAVALDQVRRKYQLPARFVLYAGAWRKNKNLPVLLDACRDLTDVPLIITGYPFTPAEAALPDLARRLGTDARFIGYVDQRDLPTLYTLAVVTVLPSRYEGFGLPVLEAMACGSPVITSDIPVLREVTGDAALHYPVDESDQLHHHLVSLLNSTSLRESYRTRGFDHVRQFTWERTAAIVTEVWDHLS